jgi:hypothetical protein
MLMYKYKTVFLFGRCTGFGGNTFGAFITKISKIYLFVLPGLSA